MWSAQAADHQPVGPVPRPLIAVLAVTALFFALWTVALKRTLTGSGASSKTGPSVPALQSAINKARGLQSVVNSASAKAGGTATQSAAHDEPERPAHPHQPGHDNSEEQLHAERQARAGLHWPRQAQRHRRAPPPRRSLPQSISQPTDVALVAQALKAHKVVALLVYNPAAADDRAVNSELKSIPTLRGKVVKLTVPVQRSGQLLQPPQRGAGQLLTHAGADQRATAGRRDRRVR